MPNQRKPVQFDHFRPYYLTTDENGVSHEHIYNLNALLQHVMSCPFSDTKKKILGDTHMFHTCRYDEDLHMWELQILHLREKILPGIADDNGAYELIRLADNQYPAESTTILYDETRCTLYLQRNIYGTSIKALEQFLQMISPEGTLMLLKPILSGTRIGRITTSNLYRKLVLVADSEQLDDEQTTQHLGQIINSSRRYQGRFIRFELGFRHQKHGLLNAHEVSSLIHEAYSFPGTHNLRVHVAENEDTPFETINLMDDRASYKLMVEYSRNNPITHERLYRMCLAEYKEEHDLL